MSKQSLQDVYYQYQSQAINYPRAYLKALPDLQRKEQVPATVVALNAINAYGVSGDFGKAMRELEDLAASLKKTGDPFLRCQWHLMRHGLIFLTTIDAQGTMEELDKAAVFQELSGSSALECEVLVHRCICNQLTWELTQCEEVLQQAMAAAIRSGQQELVMDVYLANIQLYLGNNLPDQANRELTLIREMIQPDTNPLKYTQLLNMGGIVNNMTRSHQEAEKQFQAAISLAEQNSYLFQLAQIRMNLGICLLNQRDYDGSIAMYDKCLELLPPVAGKSLPLHSKILSNKARALSMYGRLDEAIGLMEQAFAEAGSSGRLREQNIIRVNLADTLIEAERFEGVLEMLDAAIQYFEENKLWEHVQNGHLCKARYYEVRQDYQSAFDSMEQLYLAGRKYFQENFSNQGKRYRQRIEELRNEFFMLKNQCASLERLGGKDTCVSLVGEHPLIKAAIANSLQAAKYPYVNVLIYGESGTGKEIIARLIHESSQSSKPLVAINASAISPNLIESELFGHVRGAFTGAVSDHKGKFAMAHEGTLFLDEISDMPLDCQAKLLRAIEHHTIIPVGGTREIKVNCRIVSASNRKLTDLVRANQFRLDLYHRLNKVEIYLPPLRERLSDLPLLTAHFVKRFAREFGHAVPVIEESFLQRLKEHSFPGNVRELMNIIERIFILKPKSHWDAAQLDGLIGGINTPWGHTDNITDSLKQKERQLIIDTLNKVGWKQKEAARLLNMTESTLSRHIRKLGIKR